ncbi:Leucine Rich Repeat family protein [Histomonas meleagridis]|uniref:Leucine Rich Repeat family protein n=1 Tax=Histomonas meleagridis TaxID=135588 RepID=UPI003559F996|nr:Leucine Rich Repeat family protein [Histomonas meleagridis]KAH0804986.1 Leucine Rich Repeat family protein [Histomonas meleagridis]
MNEILKSYVCDLRDHLSDSQQDVYNFEKLTKENEKLSKDNQKVNKENQQLIRSLKKLLHRQKKAQRQIAKVYPIDQNLDFCTNILNLLKILHKQSNEIISTSSSSQSEYVNEDLLKQIEDAHQQIEELQKIVNEQTQNVENQIKSYEEKIKELTENIDNNKKEIEELSNDKENLTSSLEISIQKLKEANEHIKEIENKNNSIINEKQQLEKEKQNLENKNIKFKSIKVQYEEAIKELQKIRKQKEEIVEENQTLKKQNDNILSENANLKNENKSLSLKNKSIEEKFTVEKNTLLSQIKASTTMAKSDIDRIQKQYEQKLTDIFNKTKAILMNIKINEIPNDVNDAFDLLIIQIKNMKSYISHNLSKNEEIQKIQKLLKVQAGSPLLPKIQKLIETNQSIQSEYEKIKEDNESIIKAHEKIQRDFSKVQSQIIALAQWEAWAKRMIRIIRETPCKNFNHEQLRLTIEETLLSSLSNQKRFVASGNLGSPLRQKKTDNSFSDNMSETSENSFTLQAEQSGEQRAKKALSSVVNEVPRAQRELSYSNLTYLDLSYSPLKTPNFSTLSQNLSVLKLSGVPINQKIPTLQSLRTLFADNCKLNNFDYIQSLPNLRYLSLSNNNLTTFKGLPSFPLLKSIDLSSNKTSFPTVDIISAIGSLYLETVNRNSITSNDFQTAFSRSPLVGYSLRQGKPLNSSEDSITYLTQDLKKSLGKQFKTGELLIENNKIITIPYTNATNIRWYMSKYPTSQENEEWIIIKEFKTRKLVINQSMQQRLIKAEFQLKNIPKTKFSMYTSNIICIEEEDKLTMPFPIAINVKGEFTEGNLITFYPLQIPYTYKWYLYHQIYKQGKQVSEENTFVIDKSLIGEKLVLTIEPFINKFPELKFQKIHYVTDTIKRQIPIVKGIKFPDELFEGKEIKFNHQIIPQREGFSEIYIEKSTSLTSNWKVICQLDKDNLKYIPTKDDVDYYLRVSYLPILDDESTTINEIPYYFYSNNSVKPTLPTFKNVEIIGKLETGQSIVVNGTYEGGRKGKCLYKWYFSNKSFIRNKPIEAQSINFIVNNENGILRLKKKYLNLYIAVEIIPVRDDNCNGKSIFVFGDKQITEGKKTNELIKGNKTFEIYQQISFLYEFKWYRIHSKSNLELINKGKKYTPNINDSGKYIKLESNDGKHDEIIYINENISLEIKDFKISYDSCKIGSEIYLPETFYYENSIEIQSNSNTEIDWVRINPKNNQQQVIAININPYVLHENDIGHKIKAIYYILDSDDSIIKYKESSNITDVIYRTEADNFICNIKGELKVGEELSVEHENPIYSIKWLKKNYYDKFDLIIEYVFDHIDDENNIIYYKNNKNDSIADNLRLKLSDAECDCFIKAEVIFAELDDNILIPLNEKNPLVVNAVKERVKPIDFAIVLPNNYQNFLSEGTTLKLETIGKLTTYKKPKIVWEMLSEKRWIERGNGFSYTFVKSDIGNEFRIKCNEPKTLIKLPKITPMVPTVTNVEISQNEKGKIIVSGKYNGGKEGKSKIIVSYISDNDEVTLENTVVQNLVYKKSYQFSPSKKLFGKMIDVGYIPIRSDGIEGKCTWSKNGIVVKPIPSILLAKFELSEDFPMVKSSMKCIITRAILADSFSYKWSRIPLNEDHKFFKESQNNKSQVYILTSHDDNCILRCQIRAIGKNGYISESFSIEKEIHIQYNSMKFPTSLSIEIKRPPNPNKKKEITAQSSMISISSITSMQSIVSKASEILSLPNSSSNNPNNKIRKVETGYILNAIAEPLGEFNMNLIIWQYKFEDSWIDISEGESYLLTIDDFDKIIRCIFTMNGKSIFSEEVFCIIDQKTNALAASAARAGTFIFKADYVVGSDSFCTISFANGGIRVKNENGKEASCKWKDAEANAIKGTKDKMEIVLGNETKFEIIPTKIESYTSGMVSVTSLRDLCVSALRQFRKRFEKN